MHHKSVKVIKKKKKTFITSDVRVFQIEFITYKPFVTQTNNKEVTTRSSH